MNANKFIWLNSQLIQGVVHMAERWGSTPYGVLYSQTTCQFLHFSTHGLRNQSLYKSCLDAIFVYKAQGLN